MFLLPFDQLLDMLMLSVTPIPYVDPKFLFRLSCSMFLVPCFLFHHKILNNLSFVSFLCKSFNNTNSNVLEHDPLRASSYTLDVKMSKKDPVCEEKVS